MIWVPSASNAPGGGLLPEQKKYCDFVSSGVFTAKLLAKPAGGQLE